MTGPAHTELCPDCGGWGFLADLDETLDDLEIGSARTYPPCQTCEGDGVVLCVHPTRPEPSTDGSR